MISLRLYNGYWTIFVDDQPVASCATFEAAHDAVQEVAP
jgi:hypothetical protein